MLFASHEIILEISRQAERTSPDKALLSHLSVSAYLVGVRSIAFIGHLLGLVDSREGLLGCPSFSQYLDSGCFDADREYMKKIASLRRAAVNKTLQVEKCKKALETHLTYQDLRVLSDLSFDSFGSSAQKLIWTDAILCSLLENTHGLRGLLQANKALYKLTLSSVMISHLLLMRPDDRVTICRTQVRTSLLEEGGTSVFERYRFLEFQSYRSDFKRVLHFENIRRKCKLA